jgi:hypothetical protein
VIRVKRPRAAAGGKRGHLGEADKGLCQALAYALRTKDAIKAGRCTGRAASQQAGTG